MVNEKVVLVTGASRGIGAAIAHYEGTQGNIILGTATSPEGAQAITNSFNAAGIKGAGYSLNLTDKDKIDGVLDKMTQDFASPDILIHNAGITRDNLMMRMKDEEWETVIATNLSGVFYLSRACIRPMLKKRWGRIVMVGSVVGRMGNPGQTNYAAAKAGIEGFGRALAREVASRGITVNTIAPGYIETDMTRTLSPKQLALIEETIPVNRMGKPSDIAHAVNFLISEQASYITGETLQVNGGMYMN